MKILYLGDCSSRNTCVARLNALREFEGAIEVIDYAKYFGGLRRFNRIWEFRTFCGPHSRRINRDIVSAVRSLGPEVVWIDKGSCIWPSTLNSLKQTGAILVHYNTDSLWHKEWSTRWLHLLLRRSIGYYDLYFTTNVSDYHRLRLKGFRRTELTFLGYDDDRFTPTPLEVDLAKHWANKLLFVGHYEKKTEAGIKALIKANLPVRVFGLGWQSAVRRKELKSNVEFRALTDSEYEWAIKAAEIGLCFVSHGNGNQTAGRSFEIPGSGTFLLAERTEQHMECYREGVEAEFFGDTQELVSKAQFYLDRARERREIAVNGQQKCKRHYSWKTLLKGDWAKVMELVRRCPDRS